MIDERQKICELFHRIVGESGCGVSCSEAEFFKKDGEWQMFLAGFMAPWAIGQNLDEVEANLKEFAAMGHGLV